MRILPQAFQRLPLELVEGMRRAVLEGIIREKAELRVAVVSVDQVAEVEREGGWDRNGAGDFRVIGEHLRLLAVGEHAADHVAGVIVSDAVDRRRQLVGCSVSARSDRLRRSSQTAIGSPARTSSTRMMVMESLLATYPLTRSPKAAGRPDSVGESCDGSAGYGAVATISASLSRSSALSPSGGT